MSSSPDNTTSLAAALDPRALGHARSPEWHRVEQEHLAKEPFCRYCGGTKLLQVHHVSPFHLDPQRELDPSNLITLCEDYKDGVECHLHIGHLGNWKTFNPHVRDVANAPAAGTPATTAAPLTPANSTSV